MYIGAHATPLLQKSGWPIRMRGLSRSSPPSTSTGRGDLSPASPGERPVHNVLNFTLFIGIYAISCYNFRFMCNPGLGFKAPAEARVGNYIDKKCPFTGKVTFVSDL